MRYRAYAQQASEHARATDNLQVQEQYLGIERGWLALANQLSRVSD